MNLEDCRRWRIVVLCKLVDSGSGQERFARLNLLWAALQQPSLASGGGGGGGCRGGGGLHPLDPLVCEGDVVSERALAAELLLAVGHRAADQGRGPRRLPRLSLVGVCLDALVAEVGGRVPALASNLPPLLLLLVLLLPAEEPAPLVGRLGVRGPEDTQL